MEQMELRAWPWPNVTLPELEERYNHDTLELMLKWANENVRQAGDSEPAHILALLAGSTAWEMEDSPSVLCTDCACADRELYGSRTAGRYRWEFNEAPYRYFQCDGCLCQWGIDA